MRRPGSIICGLGAAVSLAGCTGGVLDPKGPVAADERAILFNALAIMLVIVVPTIVAAVAFAWWFRASNTRARHRPEFVYSGRIEVIVWSIPILTITFLGALIWIGSHRLDPYRPLPSRQPPLHVQVVSLDWKWLFIYPEQGIATVNQLVLPTGRPVSFALTSASVMNSFFVPQLGGMIYTMNGMVTQHNLQADQPGTFEGRSTMFSGDGFPGMHFAVHAVSAAAFDGWVTEARTGGPTLDATAYRQLAVQSSGVRPFTYRAADPGLFDAIASQRIASANGPRAGRGGPELHPRPLG